MPAGSLEKMRIALAYGADAVYAGVPIFSLRARENEFSFEQVETGIAEARALGKKFYLTANIFARNLKIKSFGASLAKWAALRPDAMIMADPGLIAMARERHPEIPIHLSVQANCMNWQAAKFWQAAGVSRIILSRELRLDEVREIRQRVPDMELEVFVHGSICVAYSGRCLISHYMSRRDANQGVCDNSCRYPYRLYSDKPVDPAPSFYLEDLRAPGQLYRIDEDEHGTHLMNAKDLCLVEHLQELRDAGACSFKVEGRTKSVYYAAMISRVYRQAIDDAGAGKAFDPALRAELDKLSNRGYFAGFMMGANKPGQAPEPAPESINYKPSARWQNSAFVGLAIGRAPAGAIEFEAKGQIQRGEDIVVITPQNAFVAKALELAKPNGDPCEKVHAGFGLCQGRFSRDIPPMSILCRQAAPDSSSLAAKGLDVVC
jgi:putative protease